MGFDPFEYLNANENTVQGFMYRNYSPTESARMYFTPENAGRIDYFRNQIEDWKNENLLSEEEYCYLIACLIESVSDVSNTAGVYGAFLKKWDSRATKRIVFSKVDFRPARYKSIRTYNANITHKRSSRTNENVLTASLVRCYKERECRWELE